MIVLPTLAAIVAAIVAHPVPAVCRPDVLAVDNAPTYSWGLTSYTGGVATRIDLVAPCGELGAPYDPSDAGQATAVWVAAFEAEHATHGYNPDESPDVCAASRVLPALIVPAFAGELGGDTVARAIARRIAGQLQSAAAEFVAALPARYHQDGPCP